MFDTKQRQSIISSDDGLSPSRHQAITCTSVGNCQWASRPKTWPQGGATWHMHSSKGLPQRGQSVTNVDCFLVLMKLASYRSGAKETTDWVVWNSLCCCVRASNSSSLVHYTVTSAIIRLQVFKITMPGGTHCCVPRCTNRGNGHRWPRDKERSKAWEIAVRRAGGFKPRASSLVCKAHFSPDSYVSVSYHGKQLNNMN